MSDTGRSNTSERTARQPWKDRWLLDAFRQAGNPAAELVRDAASAWEALEGAGVPSAEIARLVSDLSGAKPADLSAISATSAELLTRALAERYDVVAVRLDGRTLEVATSNPLAENVERDLAFACARRVRVVVASPSAIRQARARVYGAAAEPVRLATRLAWTVPQNALHAAPQAPTRGAAVEMLDRLVIDAIDQRASDIHIEPQDGELLVRYRVDGMLHDVSRVSAELAPLLLSRLKVSAGLDIANRLRPQDGRASLTIDGRQVDLRISTLPLGERIEKAVIRILDAGSTSHEIEALGFTPGEWQCFTRLLGANEGMVLVTGPTGSGKTTTLYSALRHVQSRERNIVTVEDPIEYRLDGINQVQVNEKAGLTFASALRSILRQDPDVVLVGEIRDAETAGIAIKASMTGHLVLSTLHTNDAPSAIGRLADIGVDSSAIANALKGVIAQRLVRRLCVECSAPLRFDALPLDQQHYLDGRDTDRLRRAVGCAACRGTGYRGRMVVAEMLLIDEETQQLMARSTQRLELTHLARINGMSTLWEAGLQRVVDGFTSMDELLTNITPPIPESDLGQDDVDRLMGELLGAQAPSDTMRDASDTSGTSVAPVSNRGDVDAGSLASRSLALGTLPGYPTFPGASGFGSTIGASLGATLGAQASRLVLAPRSVHRARPRVLIVNEGRERRRQLRKALERSGCSVIETADGDAALAYAYRLRPDAVVTEIALPKLDGIGLMQILLGEGVTERVFVYTEQHDEGLLEWAQELGASDVMTTDDDVETMATRVGVEFGMTGMERAG